LRTEKKGVGCPHDSGGHWSVPSSDLQRHLQRHLLVHAGEKPFACPHEDGAKRFNQPGALKTHQDKAL